MKAGMAKKSNHASNFYRCREELFGNAQNGLERRMSGGGKGFINAVEREGCDKLVDGEESFLEHAEQLRDELSRHGITFADALDGAVVHKHVKTDIEFLDDAGRSDGDQGAVHLGGTQCSEDDVADASGVDSVAHAFRADLLDFSDDFIAGQAAGVDRDGAQFFAEGQALFADVHGDDFFCACDQTAHDSGKSHGAAAEYRDGIAQAGTDDVEDSAGACLKSAADGRCVGQVNVIIDLDAGVHVHHGMGGEGGLAEEHGHRLAVQMQAGAAVRRNTAEVDRVEVFAIVGYVAQAVVAVPAESVGETNMVAGLDVFDIGADFFDDARTLMSENEGKRNGHALNTSECICVANAAGGIADQDFIVHGIVKIQFSKFKRTVFFENHCCFDFHTKLLEKSYASAQVQMEDKWSMHPGEILSGSHRNFSIRKLILFCIFFSNKMKKITKLCHNAQICA